MNDSFSKCIADICGLELATLAGDFKYSVFGGRTLVLEGHKGIEEYSLETISFRIGKSTLKITGSGLTLKCLEKNFAVVEGKIVSVGILSQQSNE